MISEEQEVSLATRKTKGAKGGGTIRQCPDGRWEARYTLGIDPGTGKQIQKSVYGKTQKEVRQKLTAITVCWSVSGWISFLTILGRTHAVVGL